jgi:enolase
MKITNLRAREIFDSRGHPTIECELVLDDTISVLASVPSGASRGAHEAHEKRDGGDRLEGLGVEAAIKVIETIIAPEVVGKEPNVFQVDAQMLQLDGTEHKEHLGANSILAVSIATLKAQALCEELEVYELIAHCVEAEGVALPYPMVNVINGGAHADNNLQMQEFMVVPLAAPNYHDGFLMTVEIFYYLRHIIKQQEKQFVLGDEGGLGCMFEDDQEALDTICQAIEMAGLNGHVKIALDVAASELYDPNTKTYQWEDNICSADDMIQYYQKLVEAYPIYSLEDPLDQDDWQNWVKLMETVGQTVQIVGDDLFATNVERIAYGIQMQVAHAAVIKPNQIGTITETLQALQLCKEYGLNTVVSHRSGETEDTFIADLAVGASAGQFKGGGPTRERVAKYNRLLRIEDNLLRSLLSSG